MNKVVRVVNPLQIGKGVSLQEGDPLLVVTRPHPQEDLSAESLERRGREDSLRGASTPDKKVDSGVGKRRRDGRRDVAVPNQAQ